MISSPAGFSRAQARLEAGNDASTMFTQTEKEGENDGAEFDVHACVYVALTSDNSRSRVLYRENLVLVYMTIDPDPARENLDWYFANAARVQRPLGIEARRGGGKGRRDS